MDIIETGGESMNRRTRPDKRRRIARLRRETLRVLDAGELGGVVGGGNGGGNVVDAFDKGRHLFARSGTRFCLA